MYTFFALYSLLQVAIVTADFVLPTTVLTSPLIPQKVLATFNALPNPVKYPEYSTTDGIWQYFSPDTWTSGFFPATLYAIKTRLDLCYSSATNGLGAADWLTLGRAASSSLIPLEQKNSVEHDVGFLSFPFVEELAM